MPAFYALDTNVYVRALRDPTELAGMKRFLLRVGPRVRVVATVAMELRAGARTPAQQMALAGLLAGYVARGRVLAPSYAAHCEAGRVLADLVTRERFDFASTAPSLVSDVIIACTCREAGAVLVTSNHDDYARIARQLRGFRIAEPWPD